MRLHLGLSGAWPTRPGCWPSTPPPSRWTRWSRSPSAAELEAAIEAVKGVYVEDSLNRYVVAILRHTRGDTRLALGASPRAGIALLRVAKALAAVRGREYVIPADVKEVAADVLSHRVILAADARTAGLDRRPT